MKSNLLATWEDEEISLNIVTLLPPTNLLLNSWVTGQHLGNPNKLRIWQAMIKISSRGLNGKLVVVGVGKGHGHRFEFVQEEFSFSNLDTVGENLFPNWNMLNSICDESTNPIGCQNNTAAELPFILSSSPHSLN